MDSFDDYQPWFTPPRWGAHMQEASPATQSSLRSELKTPGANDSIEQIYPKVASADYYNESPLRRLPSTPPKKQPVQQGQDTLGVTSPNYPLHNGSLLSSKKPIDSISKSTAPDPSLCITSETATTLSANYSSPSALLKNDRNTQEEESMLSASPAVCSNKSISKSSGMSSSSPTSKSPMALDVNKEDYYSYTNEEFSKALNYMMSQEELEQFREENSMLKKKMKQLSDPYYHDVIISKERVARKQAQRERDNYMRQTESLTKKLEIANARIRQLELINQQLVDSANYSGKKNQSSERYRHLNFSKEHVDPLCHHIEQLRDEDAGVFHIQKRLETYRLP